MCAALKHQDLEMEYVGALADVVRRIEKEVTKKNSYLCVSFNNVFYRCSKTRLCLCFLEQSYE